MSKNLSYTSSIKDMPFMFLEMRRTARLLCEGKTADEIVKQSIEDNIYQQEKEKRRRDIPHRCLKRLSLINKSLLKLLAYENNGESKLVAFLALIKSDRLFFEYMREVYFDKYYTGNAKLSDYDFRDFIDRKIQNSETVEKWSAATIKSVRGKIKGTLCEAGLAKRNQKILIMQPPIVDKEFCMLLEKDDIIFAKVMLIEV